MEDLILSLTPSAMWLIIVIVFSVLEGVTVTLVSIWFALGALAAFICSFFVKNMLAQIGIFAVVSLVSLLLIRPLSEKYLYKNGRVATNSDRLINQTGVVLENIDDIQATGVVKVLGQTWSAKTEDNEIIPAGTMVRVIRLEGVKLIVCKN